MLTSFQVLSRILSPRHHGIVDGSAVSAIRGPIQNAFTGIGTEIENQQSALSN